MVSWVGWVKCVNKDEKRILVSCNFQCALSALFMCTIRVCNVYVRVHMCVCVRVLYRVSYYTAGTGCMLGSWYHMKGSILV